MGRRAWWVLLVVVLGGCVAAPEAEQPAATPAGGGSLVITCHVAYRPSVTGPIQREEVVTLDEAQQQARIHLDELDFHAQYFAGTERGLRVWVTEAGSDRELVVHLYQFSESAPPRNQFPGGHGFSGLGYVYHPTTRAELQFWCVAA